MSWEEGESLWSSIIDMREAMSSCVDLPLIAPAWFSVIILLLTQ